MDFFWDVILVLRSGQLWRSNQLLPSNYSAEREQGRIAERDGDVVTGDKTESILSRYFKFLLNWLKCKENKSIAFCVRGLTLKYFSLF